MDENNNINNINNSYQNNSNPLNRLMNYGYGGIGPFELIVSSILNNNRLNLKEIKGLVNKFLIIMIFKYLLEKNGDIVRYILDHEYYQTKINIFKNSFWIKLRGFSCITCYQQEDLVRINGQTKKYGNNMLKTLIQVFGLSEIIKNNISNNRFHHKVYKMKNILVRCQILAHHEDSNLYDGYLYIYLNPKDYDCFLNDLDDRFLIKYSPNFITQYKVIDTINTDKVYTSEKRLRYVHETEFYLYFENMIQKYLKYAQILDKGNCLGLSFNGPPGTGKTSFIDFIGNKNLINYIIKLNMLKFTNHGFHDILDKLNKLSYKNKNSIIIVFDEIDKYLNLYIKTCIQTAEKNITLESTSNSQRNNNNHQNNAQNNAQNNNTNNIFNLESSIQTQRTRLSALQKHEMAIEIKEKFCQTLQLLLDGELISFERVIIIFNTNNFETIFKNTSEHFEAVKHRFTRIKFERLDKENVIEFIIKTIDKINMDNKDDNPLTYDKEYLINNVPNDIDISHRLLDQIMIMSFYEVEKIVENLNNQQLINTVEKNIKYKDTYEEIKIHGNKLTSSKSSNPKLDNMDDNPEDLDEPNSEELEDPEALDKPNSEELEDSENSENVKIINKEDESLGLDEPSLNELYYGPTEVQASVEVIEEDFNKNNSIIECITYINDQFDFILENLDKVKYGQLDGSYHIKGDESKEIITILNEELENNQKSSGKINNCRHITTIFKLLGTPKGLGFVFKNPKFAKIVLNKCIEYITILDDENYKTHPTINECLQILYVFVQKLTLIIKSFTD